MKLKWTLRSDLHNKMFVTCPPAAVLITSMLKDLNAQERDTITFEVTVNYEGITYKWLKNGVEVKSSDRCQVRSRQLTHSLTIRNVHFGDGGEYQFVSGSAASAANLFVEGNGDAVHVYCQRHAETFRLQIHERCCCCFQLV